MGDLIMATTQELDDIAPDEAVDEYLEDKEIDSSEWTVYSHSSRLGHFVEWCESEGIELISDLRPTHLREYKHWRREEGGLNNRSLDTQLNTLRVFIRWCEAMDYAPEGLRESIMTPDVDKSNQDIDGIDADRASRIRDYLWRYEYATRQCVVFSLMWHCTLRPGAVHSLDVDDVDQLNNHLSIEHRPDTGTTLKNGSDGDRVVNISDDVAELLEDWIEDQRPSVEDEYGREPLIATEQGRAHRTTITSDIYQVTWPQFIGEECSCNSCDVTCRNNAYACEDSMSPKYIRKGSITHHLDQGWPIQLVADRADNSPEVIKEHYDMASDAEKAERRKQFMDMLEGDDG